MIELGRLLKVSIRDVWGGEASDFTPWLGEDDNLRLLAETIGIDLELTATEVPVGDFRLDMLAKHEGTEEMVVVENQFGSTDHRHLGQLMTYAAGVGNDGAGAKTVIWIAECFNESHRSALDWLNKCTEPGIRFFGVEIELWRIGQSAPAPKFNLVCKPNEWQKKLTQQTSAPSVLGELYAEFWERFIEYSTRIGTTLRFPSPQPQGWMATPIGKNWLGVNFTISKQKRRVGCELYLDGADAKWAFSRLEAEKDVINQELVSVPDYQALPDRRASRIVEYREGEIGVRETWPELFAWLKSRGEAFLTVFGKRVLDANFRPLPGANSSVLDVPSTVPPTQTA